MADRLQEIARELDALDVGARRPRFKVLTDAHLARPDVAAKGPGRECAAVPRSLAAGTWAEKAVGYDPRWAAGLLCQLGAQMSELEREWYFEAALNADWPPEHVAKWAVLVAASGVLTSEQAARVEKVLTTSLAEVLRNHARSLAHAFMRRYGDRLPAYVVAVLEADIAARADEEQPGVAAAKR